MGVDPSDGAEITAQNGRYGPYLKKGTDSRSLETKSKCSRHARRSVGYLCPAEDSWTPGGRASVAGPRCRPWSGNPVLVKEGRFGPYVTDGETNATLRRGDAPESITIERAAELLAEKRAKGPAPKKRAAKNARPQESGQESHQKVRQALLSRVTL